MRCQIVLRSALLGFFGVVCAGLGGCMILPSTDVRESGMGYAATPLIGLPDGQDVYLLQECYLSIREGRSPDPCERPVNHLAVRSVPWDMQAEAQARLARRKPGDGYSLDDLQDIVAGREFSHPASARSDTDAVFVGYFQGVGLLWLRPDPAVGGRWRYEVLPRSYNVHESFLPAMVVRDGDDVWVFAERAAPCNEDLCRPLAATLGMDETALPESLRSEYMLYHANMAGRRSLQRVLPAELQRFLGESPLPLPRPDRHYQTDFNVRSAVDITTSRQDVRCFIRSASTEYIYFVMLAPLGSKHGDSSTHLRACESAVANGAVGGRVLPPAASKPPGQISDDPVVHRERSSYYCWSTSFPAGRQHGKGAYACSFVLRNPGTQAVLPHTPYLLWLSSGQGEALQVQGLTDAAGRTAVVRSEQPITLSRLRVSRRLVPADLQPLDSASWRGAWVDADFTGKRLVRATDGRGIAGTSYLVRDCQGRGGESVTDAAGWTVAYDLPQAKACPIRFQFGERERRREN